MGDNRFCTAHIADFFRAALVAGLPTYFDMLFESFYMGA
jgi:hypothetical protein